MWLLIDGYNLLFATDLVGKGRGVGWLQNARQRLLDALARFLPAAVAARTVVVFDSSQPALSGDSISTFHGSIEVVFASEYEEADELIEQLIARHPQPKRLTVISGDHRLDSAARRKKAVCYPSEAWYAQLVEGELRLAPPILKMLSENSPEDDDEGGAAGRIGPRSWVARVGLARRSDARPAGEVPPKARREAPGSPNVRPDASAMQRARSELPEDFERLFGSRRPDDEEGEADSPPERTGP